MSKRLAKTFFLIFFIFGQLHSFNNLYDLKQYVSEHVEYPEIDNSDRLNPDYSNFHRANLPSWFSSSVGKVFNFLGLKKESSWSAKQFKGLLEKLSKVRKQNSYYGSFIQKVTPKVGMKFVLWGAMHGALHSLTRDLVKLKELGVVDDNFKLVGDHFLLFNGDLIVHSPYLLETLTLVMRLMDVNPGRVFYMRGSKEETEGWHGSGLQRELEIRASHLSDEKIPLNSLVKKFFMTLPMALYLRSNDKEKPSILKISHFGIEKEELKEENFSEFLYKEDDGELETLQLKTQKISNKSVSLKAVIKSIELEDKYKQSDGLLLLSNKVPTTWALLSSPTSTYRIMYEFFYDSFCVLETFPAMEDWTISLYWQDVREMKGFEKTKYNLISGELVSQDQRFFDFTATVTGQQFLKLQKKVEMLEKKLTEMPKKTTEQKIAKIKMEKSVEKLDKPLVLGETVDLSKTSAGLGKRLQEGINLRVSKENRSGGIGGHLVKLVVLDDQYTPNLTVKNVNRFLKDYDTNFIISPLGTPTTEALISKIKQKEILGLFPYTGASIFRTPELPYFVHYRTSYANEALALLDYTIKTLQLNKFAFFYQDDSYGKAPLEASRKILKHHGINEWLEVSYLRNELKVEESVKKIKDFNPQAILFYSTFAPSAELIRKIGVENLAGKKLLGISFLTDYFRRFLENNGLDFIISRVVPNPKTSNLEIVREYREEMQKYNPSSFLTVDSLEGYINISILFDAIRKIQGPLRANKVIKKIEEMKDYRFKGLDLNFDFYTRELSKEVWIDTGGPEWISRKILPEDEEISLGKKKALLKQEPEQKQAVSSKPETSVIENGEKESIRIGCSLWSSELGGGLSPSLMKGMTLRINKTNTEGGINGKLLKIVFLDDKYDPAITKKNIKIFLEKYKIDVLLNPNGTNTLLSYFNLVKEGKVLVLFPITGAGDFRVPSDHVVHFRASYPTEGKVLTKYALDTRKLTKLAIFYQDDAAGKAGLFASRKVLKEKGLNDWLEVPYARKSASFTRQITEIEKYNPQGILFYSTDKAAAALIRQLGPHKITGKLLLGWSDLAITWFKQFIKEKGIGFVIAQVVPNAENSKLKLVQEAKEEAKKAGVVLDTFVLEAYINTDITIDILKKVKGKVTKEKIIKIISGIKDYEYAGFKLNLNPKTRELSNVVWLETEDGEWLKQEVKD